MKSVPLDTVGSNSRNQLQLGRLLRHVRVPLPRRIHLSLKKVSGMQQVKGTHSKDDHRPIEDI